jgi:BirA family transcriptional regulator, biotin operon repressor / biotin---[acetyl-CoA-carboxylase] ligase
MNDSPLKDIKLGKITAEWAKARQMKAFYKESLPSTNDRAKEEAFKPEVQEENIILYLSEHQSKGRGRNQNSWIDASPGSCLLSSWSFYLQDVPVPVTSPRAGLALFKAAVGTWSFLNWSLKAPNDLYLNDKKVAGLLLETLTQGDESRLIVGLGLNVTEHPGSVETATSLVENLPAGVPLLGEDWIGFLDRLFFELTVVIERNQDELSPSECGALVHALNLRPGKTEKYISITSDGNIETSERIIPWSSL